MSAITMSRMKFERTTSTTSSCPLSLVMYPIIASGSTVLYIGAEVLGPNDTTTLRDSLPAVLARGVRITVRIVYAEAREGFSAVARHLGIAGHPLRVFPPGGLQRDASVLDRKS